MDIAAVRTFAAAAESGQLQHAADELSLTQQAVSKRIATLERQLAVRLFTRTPRGVRLTIDGQAFLPHARELLRTAERAAASVGSAGRALRVDVLSRRIAPAALVRGFHLANPGTPLDIVALATRDEAVAALASGTIDASFRAVAPAALPRGIRSVRVLDEPHALLTGPRHALAAAGSVRTAELAGHRIWMPGNAAGTEWADYYDELAAEFGLTIETTGPNFGTEALLDTIAGSGSLATLVGEHPRLAWPAGHDLRRIPLRDPTPVYPHSLLWHEDDPHPGLAELRAHLGSAPPPADGGGTWTPRWAS